ncbi:HEAT repeat domain-containing protein [Maricaulis salignorans]|uniref:HEAT repeat n=1 Tax=Maricaulis salignorans TaxID=144026 RepID=A0A1G9LUK5_9PROT|nr:HEAT repeat domain-containing protein [Maricaulis salignorans]SDL65603.1 HEAT repeat [Maricaulis salignorans]
MFQSATNSDTVLLTAIWVASLVLVSLSVLALLALAALRSLRDLGREREQACADALSANIRNLLASRVEIAPAMLPKLQHRVVRASIAVLIGYFRNLEGEARQRLKQLLEVWEIEPALARLYRKSPRLQKLQILAIFSHLDTPSSLDLVRQQLSSEDQHIRLAALRTMVRRDPEIALENLVDLTNRSRARDMQLLATTLRRQGPRAISALEALAGAGAMEGCLRSALEGLAAIGAAETRLDLTTLANHASPRVRSSVALLAAGIVSPAGATALLRLAEDPEPAVRESAALAIGLRRRADLIEILTALITDRVWSVRFRAAQALAELGPPGRAVLRHLPDPGPGTIRIVEEVLYASGRAT